MTLNERIVRQQVKTIKAKGTEMSDTKEFHIGDILSITTGRLLSKDHVKGIYKIMGFVTGDDGISTIGLSSFADYAKDNLLSQFPQFAGIEVPETVNSRETADAFLAEMEKQFGAFHSVKRGGAHPNKPGLKSDLEYLQRVRPDGHVFIVDSEE